MFGHLGLHSLVGVVVAHQLHHVLLQLLLRVRVLLAELLQDELLGERARDGEAQELLQGGGLGGALWLRPQCL